MVSKDELYIGRCIELAKNGLGKTFPNPMVGSVLVHEGKIVGEGWHQRAGEPHAEVNAINSVIDPEILKNCTIYVSLEPCSHFGKTPPCSDLIIEKGIKKVVIGTMDPFAKVAGRGIKKLLDAGCEVKVGILEKECLDLNKRFFTFHTKKRPYIILKWAQSKNGFIAPKAKETNRPFWITNKYSGQLVHKWRGEETAILVGTTTALEDNPKLNIRKWTGNNPVRIAIDRKLKIPNEYSLLDGKQKTIIIYESGTPKVDHEKLFYEKIDFSENLSSKICEVLIKYELQSVIIEGGKKILQQFIDSKYWDEARIFTGNIHIEKGLKAPQIHGKLFNEQYIGTDILKILKND